MDLDNLFPSVNGNNAATNDALTSPPGFGLSDPVWQNSQLPLPGFETLFNLNANTSKDDSASQTDVRTSLADQGEGVKSVQTDEQLKDQSPVNNFTPSIQGSGKDPPAANGLEEHNSMEDDAVEGKMSEEMFPGGSFMGFQPLDSNGNTSTSNVQSDPKEPLKIKISLGASGQEDLDAKSSDDSRQSGDLESENENSDDVDSGEPADSGGSGRMVIDEREESMDFDDVPETDKDPGGEPEEAKDSLERADSVTSEKDAPSAESVTSEKDVPSEKAGESDMDDFAVTKNFSDEDSKLEKDEENADETTLEDKFADALEDDDDADSSASGLQIDESNLDHSYSQSPRSRRRTESQEKLDKADNSETDDATEVNVPATVDGMKVNDGEGSEVDVEGIEVKSDRSSTPVVTKESITVTTPEVYSRKRKRKQTLKAKEAWTSDDDLELMMTVNNEAESDKDEGDEMIDDPLTGGKVLKEERKVIKPKIAEEYDDEDMSGTDGEFEPPSWVHNPATLFDGINKPSGPKAQKLKKPFQFGWAREIVVRYKYDSLKPSGRPPMDVYYFTPEGKKLRSAIQIGDYLNENDDGSGLTTDHFSFHRVPLHKEPFEVIRMANMGRSAGSVKGHKHKKISLLGRGRGRPSKHSPKPSPRPGGLAHRFYDEEPEEKPKTFPELLDLKPVTQIVTQKQTARKSFRSVQEVPKRLLSPLEQTMPDPKRPKFKSADNSNHVQGNGEFKLCSLSCSGQEGKAPTLHCSVCMCLFHPACVKFVSDSATALFVCERCRKDKISSENSAAGSVIVSSVTMLMKSSTTDSTNMVQVMGATPSGLTKHIPLTVAAMTPVASGLLRPITVHKASELEPKPQPVNVPPPPSLKPMTIAAHIKSMAHGQNTSVPVPIRPALPMALNPPPLKTVRAPVASVPALTGMVPNMPKLAVKAPVSVPQLASPMGSIVRTALTNHLQQGPTGSNPTPTIISAAGSSSDIRMEGQLLTLPGNIINRIKMNEPLALKINNQSLLVNPDCFVQTSHGVKIFLPPNTLPVQTGNKMINITVPRSAASPASSIGPSSIAPSLSHSGSPSTIRDSTCTPIIVSSSIKSLQTESTAPLTTSTPIITETVSLASDANKETITESVDKSDEVSQKVDIPDQIRSPQTVKRRTRQILGINPAQCFIGQLHGGYDCLLQIFSYLSVADLLKVSQVCKRWKSIVMEPWMWRTVKLRGSHVTDWDTAMDFLQKVETKKLDLRGMQHIYDRNRTWHQITGVLDKMVDLKVINFGQCPASILHAVADKLTKLTVLTAEWITEIFEEPQMWTTNTKLDVGKFSKLTQLEELRLRGVCGLVRPSFSFSGGIEELDKMQTLQRLSITTLKDTPSHDFSFIGQLTNLVELEVGDCCNWTKENYEHLSKLEKLEILRLESGGSLEDEDGLADAIKNLKELVKLELVMFVIPSSLTEALGTLEHLEELSIWPDPRNKAEVVNTNALNAIKDLRRLKRLEWGVVTNTGEEGDEESPNQGKLPFLSSAFIERKEPESSGEGENSMDTDDAKKDEVHIEEISSQTLHDHLSAMLVETVITVNDVAVLSMQKGRSRTRST